MNWPIVKGKATRQAHVALPEGSFEEEHGREGLCYSRVTSLSHASADGLDAHCGELASARILSR